MVDKKMHTTELYKKDKLNHSKTEETKPKKPLICSGCHQPADALFQNDLCRSCLNQIFKKLVHVIDSVRQ